MNGYMSIRDGMRRNMALKAVGYPYRVRVGRATLLFTLTHTHARKQDVKMLQKSLDIAELAVVRGIFMGACLFLALCRVVCCDICVALVLGLIV